jgi:hypothetical protein
VVLAGERLPIFISKRDENFRLLVRHETWRPNGALGLAKPTVMSVKDFP